MERSLNLVKNDFEKMEKRVLPRFPFCYLFFKADQTNKTYEIKDISLTGMQLHIKDTETSSHLERGIMVSGEIHWLGKNVEIFGEVKWQTADRIGVEFTKKQGLLQSVESFLSLRDVAARLKPLHQFQLDLPLKLKYWLWADGPVEIFVWQHSDGEISQIQFLVFDNFVEWIDGKGLRTGHIVSKRDIDTPLISEDEWLFKMDSNHHLEKIHQLKNLLQYVDESHFPSELKSFILRQLG